MTHAWSEFTFCDGEDPVAVARSLFEELQFTRSSCPECLVPIDKRSARPNSLSRSVGRTEQPPHTDGAHLSLPPAYILLWSLTADESHARTNIWEIHLSALDTNFVLNLRRSIWSVRTRSDRFHYRRCLEADGSIRWDSACFRRCVVGSVRPREVDQQLSKMIKQEVTWKPGKAVLINNRRTLHGRSDSSGRQDDNRRLFRVSFYEQ